MRLRRNQRKTNKGVVKPGPDDHARQVHARHALVDNTRQWTIDVGSPRSTPRYNQAIPADERTPELEPATGGFITKQAACYTEELNMFLMHKLSGAVCDTPTCEPPSVAPSSLGWPGRETPLANTEKPSR